MGAKVLVGEVDVLARGLVGLVGAAMRGSAERLSIALPGGSTAETLLPPLAAAALDWKRWDFFWGDERAVAPEHLDSNYGLGQRLFLGPIRAEARQVHRMKADAPDLQAAARDYEAEMVAALGDPPTLDLALMGMGPDGHVCSLFPGHEALREGTRWVLAVSDSPKPPPLRVTLSLPALAAARVVCVAAFGESKAHALQAALEDTGSALPVAHLARRQGETHFLLDPAAASRLSRS